MNPWTRLRDLVVGTAIEIGALTVLLQQVVRHRVDAVAARGAVGSEEALRRAATAREAAVTALATAVATSALVEKIVDAQLERVLRPLVRGILDDVLEQLEREPDRIQTLVRGQRDTMVDELVGRIRSGAAAGDTAVDRITARVLHREND